VRKEGAKHLAQEFVQRWGTCCEDLFSIKKCHTELVEVRPPLVGVDGDSKGKGRPFDRLRMTF